MKFLLLLLLVLTTTINASNFGSKDWLIEVSKGNVPGHSIVNKFGSNALVGTSLVPVSEGGIYPTPTTLTSLEILSDDNTNDTAGQAGARVVTVTGIGTAWAEVSEDVIMNGTTPVALSNQYFRVFRVRVKESGTYATASTPSHASTITLRVASAGATWATIISEGGVFGLSSTEIAAYTVPAGFTAYLLSGHLDVETTKVVDVILFKRESADTVSAPFSPMIALELLRGVEGSHPLEARAPLLIASGPADVGFMAKVSTGTAKVEAKFQILLIAD